MARIRFLFILAALGIAVVLLSPGCDELVTETITIIEAGHPSANFRILVDTTVNPRVGDSGCLGNNSEFVVYFDDLSQGPIARWSWDFGDGSDPVTLYADSGDNGDISHAYDSVGTFSVRLSIFDTLDGTDVEFRKRAVIVGQSIDSMTVQDHDTIICPGTQVTFLAHNPFGVTEWEWDFGDGTPAVTNSDTAQVHAWQDPGTYEVSLIVKGQCDSTYLSRTILVMSCAEAYMTVSPHEICAGDAVQFHDSTDTYLWDSVGDTALGVVVLWTFDWGDGRLDYFDSRPTPDSNDFISTVYPVADTVEVSLTVTTRSNGIDANSTTYDTIVVLPSDNSFTAAPTQDCKISPTDQMWVAFTRESSGDTSWLWDFGDGTSDTRQNPYHSYTVAGKYTVRLTVRGACGSDSAQTISLANLVTFSDQLADSVAFSFVQDVDSTLKYTFTDESDSAVVVSRVWDFGDGTTGSIEREITHRYPDSTASYTVKLTRFNLCDSLFDSITVDVDSLTGT